MNTPKLRLIALSVAALFLTSGCDVFRDPPPRYNTVSGTRQAPKLNPGGSGPSGLPMDERYEPSYPGRPSPSPAALGTLQPQAGPAAAMRAAAPSAASGYDTATHAPGTSQQGAGNATRQLAGNARKMPRENQAALQQRQAQPAQANPVPQVMATTLPPPAYDTSLAAEAAAAFRGVEQTPIAPPPPAVSAPATPIAETKAYPQLSQVPPTPPGVRERAAQTRQEFEQLQQEQRQSTRMQTQAYGGPPPAPAPAYSAPPPAVPQPMQAYAAPQPVFTAPQPQPLPRYVPPPLTSAQTPPPTSAAPPKPQVQAYAPPAESGMEPIVLRPPMNLNAPESDRMPSSRYESRRTYERRLDLYQP